MGCGMSSTLDPEDGTLTRPPHKVVLPIADINSPTNKVLVHACDDSVKSSTQGDPEAERGIKNGAEEKEDVYMSEILFVPGSPSFKDYCIGSHSRDPSCDTTDSVFSTKNGGDEDSAKGNKDNKPGDNKGIKKKERRGFRNVIHKGMSRRKKNLLNFGCYSSHASYDDIALKKAVGKIA